MGNARCCFIFLYNLSGDWRRNLVICTQLVSECQEIWFKFRLSYKLEMYDMTRNIMKRALFVYNTKTCWLFNLWTDQLLEHSQPNAVWCFCQKESQTPKKEAKAKQEDNESWIRRHEGQSWYTSIKWVPNTVEYPLLNKVKVPCREDSNYIPTKKHKTNWLLWKNVTFLLFGFLCF